MAKLFALTILRLYQVYGYLILHRRLFFWPALYPISSHNLRLLKRVSLLVENTCHEGELLHSGPNLGFRHRASTSTGGLPSTKSAWPRPCIIFLLRPEPFSDSAPVQATPSQVAQGYKHYPITLPARAALLKPSASSSSVSQICRC